MLILLSAILGYLTNWWWFPASAGLLGQALHFSSSTRYRRMLREGGALPAVIGATALLTLACLLAFGAGRWLRGIL